MKNRAPLLLPALCLSLFFLVSCGSNDRPAADGRDGKVVDTFSHPYKATYSADITLSVHPENLQKVLTVWKMFETNQIAAMKQYYADTVTYEDASGMKFHGRSDDLLKLAGQDIENLDSLRFDISMWQDIHINDRNEDWVYIWAAERRYPKKGIADTSLIHEQWKIENGKVAYFNQYKSKLPR
jgi:hypothetical protein